MKPNTQSDPVKHAGFRLDVKPRPVLTLQTFFGKASGGGGQSVLCGASREFNGRKVSGIPMHSESSSPEATLIALAAFSTWTRIDDALAPIIGKRGVSGLYKRSLSLTRAAHPALAVVFDGALQPGDYTTLQSALAHESSHVAIAASEALLQTFSDLLSKLIGQSLTERLMQPILDHPSSSGTAVKDTST